MQFANTSPFCDIQTRYDPEYYSKYNPNSVENRLNWNPSESFQNYLNYVHARREQRHSQEVEDALMAVIDSMNESEDEKNGAAQDMQKADALHSASRAISEETRGRADPTGYPEVQVLLACLGDRARLEMTDEIQEEHEKQMEQLKAKETDETLKGGERDECDRPVYDATDAADGGWNGEYAQNPKQCEAGGQ